MDKSGPDHAIMKPYWKRVSDVRGGILAMRKAGKDYLPKFRSETTDQYKERLELTKMTNVFDEALVTLAAKPFQEPIMLKGEVPETIAAIQYDIDGQGNNLTMFATKLFEQGIANGLHWVMVDNPPKPEGEISVAEAKLRGHRPYWVHVLASNVLEVKSEMVGGKEVLTYVRIMEPGEKPQVRVIMRNVATGIVSYELHERVIDEETKKIDWKRVQTGELPIRRIPLLPFITGMREGATYVIKPPLRDAVDLQIELFLAESGAKHLANIANYPMLAANGVKPTIAADGKSIEPIAVGPMRVLYAPPDGQGNHGNWGYIEPSGESLRLSKMDCKETETSLRELMRQPLNVNSENITVITSAVAAGKTKTLVGAWRLGLIDFLENALILTCEWVDESYDPEVWVFEDFDGFLDGKDLSELIQLREDRQISQETFWKELVRRRVLSSDFDAELEKTLLLAEAPADPLSITGE